MSDLLTVNQVAAFYHVSAATVRRWIREGRIDYVLVGPARARRIERTTVERYYERRTVVKAAT